MERTFFKVTRWARAARFWLLLLGALLAWVGCSGEARAADYACTTGAPCNRGEAHASCMAEMADVKAWAPTIGWTVVNEQCRGGQGNTATNGHYQPQGAYRNSSGTIVENFNGKTHTYFSGCPAPQVWNETRKQCWEGCNNAPPIVGAATRGSISACHNGCSYDPDASMLNACLSVGHDVAGGAIAPDYCMAARWRPNGQECGSNNTEPNDPNKPTCISTGGGFAHCVNADGSQCVTGASGRRYCWNAGESGPRNSSDGTEGASLGSPENPPTPPPAMQNPTTTGEGGTVTSGGNTTITNNYTGSGNSGGQGNVGTGGSDTPGSGVGGGSGNGSGDGEGNEPGSPAPVGDPLYESDGEGGFDAMWEEYKTRVSNSEIVSVATNFFTISPSGGSCPVWTIPASQWNEPLVFDFFCNPALQQILTWAGYILLAVAVMYAFHIAIGD